MTIKPGGAVDLNDMANLASEIDVTKWLGLVNDIKKKKTMASLEVCPLHAM